MATGWPRRRDPPSRHRVPSFWQHALLVGPALGFVSAVYQRMLEQGSPRVADPATGHVIRQARNWHGRVLENYYVTPGQFFMEQSLAIPVACWMIFVILGLVGLGIRTDADKRRRRR